MIRVIASDMDGTLLNEKHLLNERTIQAIISAQKAGIRFLADKAAVAADFHLRKWRLLL